MKIVFGHIICYFVHESTDLEVLKFSVAACDVFMLTKMAEILNCENKLIQLNTWMINYNFNLKKNVNWCLHKAQVESPEQRALYPNMTADVILKFRLTNRQMMFLTWEPRPHCPSLRSAESSSGISGDRWRQRTKQSVVKKTDNSHTKQSWFIIATTVWYPHRHEGGVYPNLVLIPHKIHETPVLLTGARGERGGTGTGHGIVILTDWSVGNLLGRRQLQMCW